MAAPAAQTSAGTVSDRFQQASSYEEVLKNRVLYRVCIARTLPVSEIAPSKRNETVVSATSLKVHGPQAGVGIEFKIVPSFPLPLITSLSPYGRAVLSGLVDVGDLLHTVDGVSVRGLEISAVVQKIIGPANSRVTLEIFRPRETAHIPPTPVMIAPFQHQEIVLKRALTAQDNAKGSKVAGLGILFHKANYEGIHLPTTNDLGYPVIVQALSQEGSAGRSGLIKPGDMIMAIGGVDTRGLQVQDVTELLRGPQDSEVRLTIDRGEEYPIIFSHVTPNSAFKAPKGAFYIQVFRTDKSIGINLSMQAGGEAIAQSNLSSPLRDVHHIVHYGPGPAPKSISNIAFDSPAQGSGLEEGMLLHAIDGISVHGPEFTVKAAESLMEGSPGSPFRLLVSRPEQKLVPQIPARKLAAAAPPPPPVDVPVVEKIVEKIVEVEKIVYLDRPVEKIVYLDRVVEVEVATNEPVPVLVQQVQQKKAAAAPPPQTVDVPEPKVVYKDKIVEKVVEKIVTVEKPVEKIVTVEKLVEKIVEVVKEVVREVPVEVVREVIKEVPVEKIVEKTVEVPVEKIHEIIYHPFPTYQPQPTTIQSLKSPSYPPLYSTQQFPQNNVQQYPNNVQQYPQAVYGSQQYPQGMYGTQQYPQSPMSNGMGTFQ